MICTVCRGSGISPVSTSSSRAVRRIMARMITTRLPCGACRGSGYLPDYKKPEPAARPSSPPSGGLSAEDRALFEKAFGVIDKGGEQGEVSKQEGDALRSILAEFKGIAERPAATTDEMGTRVLDMKDLIARSRDVFERQKLKRPKGGR